MNRQKLSAGLGRVTAIFLLCGSVYGQGKDDFIIVDDPRPVAEAVIQLMARYPVVITYEDPRYTYTGDLRDVTDEIRNPQAPPRSDDRRIHVPVGGQIQIRYSVSPETDRPADLKATLETLVQAKAAMPAGGRFRVAQTGSVFHVVASQVRDANGRWVEHTSVLDVPITIKAGELSGSEMVRAILDEVTAKSGTKFAMTTMPVAKTMASYRGILDVSNESARDVLLRALHAMSDRLTWLLYYDAPSQAYYFNVVAASADPTIEIRGQPASPIRAGDPSPTGRHVPREGN